MVDTTRLTTLETQVITVGNSSSDNIRLTAIESQVITVGNSSSDGIRLTDMEIQAVSSMFNKTCIVAISC